jgi:antitoxin ParD1/3/4
MAQMNISLPESLKGWAEKRVSEGRYANTSDLVRDLIRRDQDADAEISWLNEAIDEGLASPPSERSVSEIMARQRAALG